MLGCDSWNWCKILGVDLANQFGSSSHFHALRDKLATFKLEQRSDRALWRWSPDGRFTVKSTYATLIDEGLRDARASKIWRLPLSLKVKVFCWLVLKRRTPTLDNLIKRGRTGDANCVLCRTEEETVDHLFSRCVFTKFLLVKTNEEVHPTDLANDVTSAWDRWSGRRGSKLKCTRLPDLVACWWIIWELRNRVIFRNATPDPSLTVQKQLQLTKLWELLHPANHPPSNL